MTWEIGLFLERMDTKKFLHVYKVGIESDNCKVLAEMNIMAMIHHQNITLITFANATLLQFKSSLSARNSQSTRKIMKHVQHVTKNNSIF